jgi:CubicO group peptidase (beta-lactamase class C family)
MPFFAPTYRIMKKYLHKGFIALLIFSFSNTVFAQADSIDFFVKNQMQKLRIPGLQLAIVQHGKIIKTGNYGLANIQDSIAVNNNTVFNLNSITKAFTGVAILQLVEAGKLDLALPVSTYLTNLPEAWKPVTIQQLLSHTSGIPDIVNEEEAVMIAATGEEAWKMVLQMPVVFKPGERFSYNQTNYLLLGRIIDKLSEMSFQEFISKEQLQKLGMIKTMRSGFGATKEIVANAANSYQFSKGKLNNMFFSFPSFLQTAAGMSSTATEMAQWIIALQNMQLLKQKSSMAALWAPALLNNGQTGGFNGLLNGYAAGWPIIARTTHPAVASVGGGRSAIFVYPNDNLSIIVLTNLAGASPDAFIDEMAGLFIPDMKEINGFGLSSSVRLLKLALDKGGYKNAFKEAKNLKKSSKEFQLSERELNSWGYKLINQKRMRDALEIFKLNVELFPKSGNAFDSLGEIYAALGDTQPAIKNYEESLRLDPENRNAGEQIKLLKSKIEN